MVDGSSNNSRVDFPSPTVINTTVRVGRKTRRSAPCMTIHAPFKPL
ncbi:hypothetical protein NC652_032884 [Populus alba x Populus x berolinensis]|nr:hypothetical protein NC652_032884 [Populus alba x Populus x berolinensis]